MWQAKSVKLKIGSGLQGVPFFLYCQDFWIQTDSTEIRKKGNICTISRSEMQVIKPKTRIYILRRSLLGQKKNLFAK